MSPTVTLGVCELDDWVPMAAFGPTHLLSRNSAHSSHRRPLGNRQNPYSLPALSFLITRRPPISPQWTDAGLAMVVAVVVAVVSQVWEGRSNATPPLTAPAE